MACTKEVSLITEVEFQLLEQHSAEGFINQGLPTTFTIVPEDTLKNYEYTITYEILGGKGYFEDMDGNLLESGKGQSFPTNLISSFMYKGSEIGVHRVKIVGSDNFGLSEEIEVTYNLSDVPVVWEASSELSELELDKPAGLSLLLGTDNTAEDITYEAIYGFVPGPGILVPSQENGYVPTGEYNPIVAGNYPLVFTPSEVGPQQLTFTLRDSNGQEIETILDFNVIEFIDITSITLEPASANIRVDETQNLELVITPANASNQNVSWSSSDEAIATVDATGLVTGISQGSVTITASANDSSQVVGTASITVGSEDVGLIGIILTPSPVSLIAGSTQQLTIDFDPANTTNKNVTWSTSDPSKATVSDTGLVKTIEAGSVIITATSDADSSIFGNSAITINPINNNPVAADDDYTVAETGNLNVFILTNDTDDENNDLTVIRVNGSQANVGQAVSGSAGGLFTITGGGNLTFDTNNAFDDLNNGENRTTTISYGITDGDSNSNIATVTVTVTGVDDINNAPVAVSDTYTVFENSSNNSFDVLNNDSDVDPMDTILIMDVENPINGTASIGSMQQTIIYNATTGNDRFDYTITDGNGGERTATIDVNVIPNENPTVEINDRILIPPGDYPKTVNFQVSNFNDDGTIVDYEWNFGDLGSMGNIINNADDSTVSHTFDTAGTYNVVLTVTDNLGATGSDTVEIVLEEPLAPDFTFSANLYNPMTGDGYSNPVDIYFNISPNSALLSGSYTMVMTGGKSTLNINGSNYREGRDIPMTTGAIIGAFADLNLMDVVDITFRVTEATTGISKLQNVTIRYCTSMCP
ncbi:Ig-like domain-containing protein [Zobellia nedashkovskayae]